MSRDHSSRGPDCVVDRMRQAYIHFRFQFAKIQEKFGLREKRNRNRQNKKKGTDFGSLIKKLAATYFSTNKCSIIGDVRLLPGSDTYLPTHSSLISYISTVCNSYHSFFFELILLSCLQLLSLLFLLPTLELFRLDYLQLSHLHLHSSAVPLSCRLTLI